MSEDMVPSVKATVALHEGETSHWEVNADGDLQVTCLSHGHSAPITALLGAIVGGKGKGVWVIPPIGTEVLVCFPDGDYEGDAVIVGALSTGSVPAALADGNVVIVGAPVFISDGAGGAAVEVRPADVRIGGGVAPHEPTLKATTYRTAEDLMLTAMTTWLAALAVYIVIPVPTAPQTATYTAAQGVFAASIATFQAGTATYPTTIAKVR